MTRAVGRETVTRGSAGAGVRLPSPVTLLAWQGYTSHLDWCYLEPCGSGCTARVQRAVFTSPLWDA